MAENGSKTTIVVALISVVGVLGAALIANLDKLKSTGSATERPSSKQRERPSESPSVVTLENQSAAQPATRPSEDLLLGHWVSTFENPLFSVIDISREGSELRVRAYVNNRGPDKGGCVYDTVLDGKRGVFAKGKKIEWQLPTLPLPCANWVQDGFTGASLSVASVTGMPDTLATVVNMYANQKLLGGSGPTTYIRK